MKAIKERLEDVKRVYVYGDARDENRYETEFKRNGDGLNISFVVSKLFGRPKVLQPLNPYIPSLVSDSAMLIGQNIVVVGVDKEDERVIVIKGLC